MPGEQNRRAFLQLIGAAGATASAVGVGAASYDDRDGETPEVDLRVPQLSRCRKYCKGADYVVPLGATIDFTASYRGNGSFARIRKINKHTGHKKTIKECESRRRGSKQYGHGRRNPFKDCENFHVTFRETGKFDIEAEFWTQEGVINGQETEPVEGDGGRRGGRGGRGGHGGRGGRGGHGGHPGDCDDFQSVDCDTVTVEVIRPKPKLEVVEPKHLPATVNERVIFQSGIENLYFDYDLIDDWRLETRRVPDELLPEPPGEPEYGKRFARLPTQTGTYIAVAIAEIGDFEFKSDQLSFDVVRKRGGGGGGHHGKLKYRNPRIYTRREHGKKFAYGEVTVKNKSRHRQTTTLKLKAVGTKWKTLDEKTKTIHPHQHKRVELHGWFKRLRKAGKIGTDGHGHEDYEKIVLKADGEVIETKYL